MKNLPCQDPFVELITTFPLDLIYGSVRKSGSHLAQTRLSSLLDKGAMLIPSKENKFSWEKVVWSLKSPRVFCESKHLLGLFWCVS